MLRVLSRKIDISPKAQAFLPRLARSRHASVMTGADLQAVRHSPGPDDWGKAVRPSLSLAAAHVLGASGRDAR